MLTGLLILCEDFSVDRQSQRDAWLESQPIDFGRSRLGQEDFGLFMDFQGTSPRQSLFCRYHLRSDFSPSAVCDLKNLRLFLLFCNQ